MPTFHVYLANDGWRWRLRASNNRIIAESGEAYTRRDRAQQALQRVRDAFEREGYALRLHERTEHDYA
jgi:uncharacterized protein YegP (UPF0339 family)